VAQRPQAQPLQLAKALQEHRRTRSSSLQGATAQPSYQGAEKRRSPRYKCEGSAEMRELSCDVHTWATVTDISRHGCYEKPKPPIRWGLFCK
jgi:hypothetical protein